MTASDRLPPGHPPAPHGRIGVLIGNLGTPDATDYRTVRRYLSEFLSDKRVIDYPAWKWQPILQLIILSTRPQKTGANYRLIWNEELDESPLLTITRAQVEAIRADLAADYGDRVLVDFCMRYGNPSTASRLRAMVEAGCDRVLFLPLYPQYSSATTATANDELFRALMREKRQPAVRTVGAYMDDPAYVAALAASVTRAFEGRERPQRLVCSYHGLPERFLGEGDPYHCHCHKTTRLLREALGWPEESMVTTFQSRFGREEWLKPYTVEEVARLARAGITRIGILAPAFAADCIETLEEIQGEIQDAFKAAGGEDFTYVPCLNDDPGHIAALTGIIRANLGGWIAAE